MISLTNEGIVAILRQCHELNLQCKAMKLEIDKLKAEREQLVALAKFGKWCLSSPEEEFESITLNAKAEEFGLVARDDNYLLNYSETPLAQLPEGIE